MESNDKKNKNSGNEDQVDQRHEIDTGMEGNNNPEANKQESYVKQDQQSDLSYGRNSGREVDEKNDSEK